MEKGSHTRSRAHSCSCGLTNPLAGSVGVGISSDAAFLSLASSAFFLTNNELLSLISGFCGGTFLPYASSILETLDQVRWAGMYAINCRTRLLP